jgi:hypothetical protein
MQSARPQNTFQQTLTKFVQLGQEILSTDYVSHYGKRIGKFRGLQPGFMPLKEAKLCVIGCYPSFQSSLAGTTAREAEEKTLQGWKGAGSLESYEAAYKTFLRDFVDWNITKKYVIRVLEEAHVQTNEIAWLDVIKVPLESRSPKSLVEDLSKRDLPWLRKQIELVHANSIASHRSLTDLPCLIETKLAESLIQTSQEFYLRSLLVDSEVQSQTHGQTTVQIKEESKLIGHKLREKIRRARVSSPKTQPV